MAHNYLLFPVSEIRANATQWCSANVKYLSSFVELRFDFYVAIIL